VLDETNTQLTFMMRHKWVSLTAIAHEEQKSYRNFNNVLGVVVDAPVQVKIIQTF